MTDESPFRLVVVALCVLALTISLYYRRAAVRSGEKVSRREEGLVIMILLRLFGSCAAIVVLMYLIQHGEGQRNGPKQFSSMWILGNLRETQLRVARVLCVSIV